MKVLFICYANVCRSQVAEACFKTLSQHEPDLCRGDGAESGRRRNSRQ